MTSDAITRLFHKGYSGKLNDDDLIQLENFLFNIDVEDGDIFLLVETIGYALFYEFNFKNNVQVQDKLIGWTNRSNNPALAGTCLHVLVFKCHWFSDDAKNKIIDFLTPTEWDEGFEAMGSAISAASIWLKHFGNDNEINSKLDRLLENKNIPIIIKKQIKEMR